MNGLPTMFADVDPHDLIAQWRRLEPATQESLLVVGALIVVTFLVLAWAVFFRKRDRSNRKHRHEHRSSRESAPRETSQGSQEPGSGEGRHRRKWRRRRREHRPRNPTLSETGGLPPIRTNGPSSPAP